MISSCDKQMRDIHHYSCVIIRNEKVLNISTEYSKYRNNDGSFVYLIRQFLPFITLSLLNSFCQIVRFKNK